MNQRKMYHEVKEITTGWDVVTRHFRANVVQFSRAVARASSSQLRVIAGHAEGEADSQRRRLQRFVKREYDMAAIFKAWTQRLVSMLGLKDLTLIVDETKAHVGGGSLPRLEIARLASRGGGLHLPTTVGTLVDTPQYRLCVAVSVGRLV